VSLDFFSLLASGLLEDSLELESDDEPPSWLAFAAGADEEPLRLSVR
jgi:hypothetical protein